MPRYNENVRSGVKLQRAAIDLKDIRAELARFRLSDLAHYAKPMAEFIEHLQEGERMLKELSEVIDSDYFGTDPG